MQKERTFKDKLTLFLKGVLMGAANKVPRKNENSIRSCVPNIMLTIEM